MLIVLCNAVSEAQVHPLLPGIDSCLVVVMSRSWMSRLVARDGANRVRVDMLVEAESLDLIRNVTADYRKEDSPEDLAEPVRLCGRFSLALRIAGERAASRPWMPSYKLVVDLPLRPRRRTENAEPNDGPSVSQRRAESGVGS
ncbi:hypothetical protein GCM10009555_040190 [Acrocarpospora macrocephala]|uniref:Uncharacterized protein n=1 Tax=Acrocarpospora macrocephala TaxID=150177 RepID=A0A5M3WV43_9ACTN|nr:hypothetical protein [Acrocarpospora macrocephala]GES10008.1 hypothetical protein Amac_036040 [Acrocarpospora macrocephala]